MHSAKSRSSQLTFVGKKKKKHLSECGMFVILIRHVATALLTATSHDNVCTNVSQTQTGKHDGLNSVYHNRS